MNNRLHPLFYIIPYGIFLFLIHAFYSNGQLNLFEDAKVSCIYMNYFLNHIIRGVYPFWNPFSSWGRPDDILARMTGEFNPFLYIIVLLQKIGLRFSLAYFGYLIIYFTLGIAGVYFLAKQLFKDPVIVWLACLAVMFSNLSGNLFNNIVVILIFVPTVWFFNFLIRFTEDPQKPYLLGIVFCLMVILTTYMPFHFTVIFFTFLALYVCIYFLNFPSIIHRYIVFISKNKAFTLFCLFSFFISAIPGFLWYRSNSKGDIVYAWRGDQHSMFLSRDMIDSGNFIGMHGFTSPISNLQDAQLPSLYLPFIFILIGLLGMVLPLSRRRSLLFVMGLFLFLLTMTNASPLMGFLYQHIFIFKLFRNTHFFVWAFGTVAALLAIDIFQGLVDLQPKMKIQRYGLCVFVLALHLSALIILNRCWSVNFSTYITLAASCIFFVLYFADIIKKGSISFLLGVLFILLLQPVEALWHVEHNSAFNQQFPYTLKPNSYQGSIPEFSYLRPTFDEDAKLIDTEDMGNVSDRSGYLKDLWWYHGTRWSFATLQDSLAKKDRQEYVRHKFVLYPPHQDVSLGLTHDFPAGKWIDSASDQFKVTAFDMNYIKLRTKFSQDQLLVYNDSFQADWQAFINGHRVPIIRANVAFKGIYLPAGSNEVLFSFHTPLYRGFFIFLILYFHLILIILAILFFKRAKYAALR